MCPTGTTLRLVNDFSIDATSEFRRAFDVIDVDHDGRISGDDLRSFYGAVSVVGGEEEAMIRTMMMLADANKDGYVEYEEFEKVLLKGRKNGESSSSRCYGDSAVMEEVFKVMDKDGDGKLGVDDLKSYLECAGIMVQDEEEIKAMIKLGGCGEACDGVSFDAFLNLFSLPSF